MRRSQIDGGSQPVRNLFLNPGCETAGNLTTVRTNLFTNPSFETGSGTVVVRKNLATDPRATVNNVTNNTTGWRTTRWFGAAPAAGTHTFVTGATDGPLPGLTTYLRKTWTATPPAGPGDTGFDHTVGWGTAILPNTPYTVSSYMRTSASGKTHAGMAIVWKDAAGATISTSTAGGQNLTPGEWKRLSWTATSPADAAYMAVLSDQDGGTAWAIGDTLDGTGLLIEQSPALEPYFDGATTSLNLAPNPSLETNSTDWNQYAGASGTSAGSRPATGGYKGTYFYRVTWTVSQSGAHAGGGYGDAPVTPGLPYSVRIATRSSKTQKLRLRIEWLVPARTSTITTSSSVDYDVPPGEWRECALENAIAPAGAGWARLTIYSAPTGTAWNAGDTLDLDMLTVEQGTTAPAYCYDNGGDYTYSWLTTANASISQQQATQAVSCSSGGAGGNSAAFQSTSPWKAGAKSLHIKAISGSGDSFSSIGGDTGGIRLGIIPGRTYTFTATAYVPGGAAAQNSREIRAYYKAPSTGAGYIAFTSPQTALDGNNTRRAALTVTFPADTTEAFVRLYNGHAANTGLGDVWWDDFLAEETTAAKPYFDGATPAAGDFTYIWTGTAHASTSQQRATGLAIFGIGNGSATVQSSEWSVGGSKSLRIVPNSITSSQDTFAYVSTATLAPGTYTLLATLRTTAPHTTTEQRARRIVAYHSGTQDMSTQPPNVAGVYPQRLTFKVLDGSVYQSFRLYNGGANGQPDVWWDNIMLVEGTYAGDYIDGSKPLSKWTGTVNNSASIGYPPGLIELGGKPSVDLVGVSNTGGVPIPVAPYAARTIYLCYECVGTTQNYGVFGYYGIPGNGGKGIAFQGGATGSLALAPRLDSPGGETNRVFSISNGKASRVHVFALSLNEGLTSTSMCIDGLADFTAAFNPGTGWDDGRVLAGTGADGKALRMLVYYAEHDRATRLAISRHLGNKYGAQIA